MIGSVINHKPEFYYEVLYALRSPQRRVIFPESETIMGWKASWNLAASMASPTYWGSRGLETDPNVPCMQCGETPTRLVSSRTCYHYEKGELNPNYDWIFCEECANDHHEYWDEMWSEYYSGLL